MVLMSVIQEAKALAAGRSDARGVFQQKPTSQFDDSNRQPAPAKYVLASYTLNLSWTFHFIYTC